MGRHDVLGEGCVLAECLITWWIFSAAKFVPPVVRGIVSSKSGPCHKGFTAAWTIANVIADRTMSTLDMMVEVGDS